jgi:hypothetical protein
MKGLLTRLGKWLLKRGAEELEKEVDKKVRE